MDEQPPPSGALWRRLLSYLLVLLGIGATLFGGDIGRRLNIEVTLIQFGSLALLVSGAALFFSVRVRADRFNSYRSLEATEEDTDTSKNTKE